MREKGNEECPKFTVANVSIIKELKKCLIPRVLFTFTLGGLNVPLVNQRPMLEIRPLYPTAITNVRLMFRAKRRFKRKENGNRNGKDIKQKEEMLFLGQ